jgi:hypothetical protein
MEDLGKEHFRQKEQQEEKPWDYNQVYTFKEQKGRQKLM